jgi:ribA/ribD-fused uncharacterized protein
MEIIKDFHSDEFCFLSNFHPSWITFGDWEFRTLEHAFQAAKCTNPEEVSRIALVATPGQAKRMGRLVALRPHWDLIKAEMMFSLLMLKFTQNEDLFNRLMMIPGGTIIVEGNKWHDNYWGDCSCPKCINEPGLNILGQLLMMLRVNLGSKVI